MRRSNMHRTKDSSETDPHGSTERNGRINGTNGNAIDIRLDSILNNGGTVRPAIDHDEQRRNKIQLISSKEFAETEYHQKWLIKGILVKGQPAVLGGPRKSLKTSILVDLAISLAAPRLKIAPESAKSANNGLETRGRNIVMGRVGSTTCQGEPWKFLGNFEVPERCRVGLFSGESGPATIQETARRICSSKGTSLENSRVFWGFNLPRLCDRKDLDVIRAIIIKNRLEVVLFDPLYLALVGGEREIDTANLFHVGPLLAELTQVCLEAGATPILAHHARKNRSPDERYEPLELEDLSYSGIQEFARQWLLISRREKYEPGTGSHRLWLSIGGSAGFGGLYGLNIEEGTIDESFKSRFWDVCLIKPEEAREAIKQAKELRKQAGTAAKTSKDRQRVLEYLTEMSAADTLTGIADALHMSKGVAGELLKSMRSEVDSDIEFVPKSSADAIKGKNGQAYSGYRFKK